MPKPVKTFIKVKGTDLKYEASGHNATYEQVVKHYLSVLSAEYLVDELISRGYAIEKIEKEI